MKHFAFTLLMCTLLVSCGQNTSDNTVLNEEPQDMIETTQATNF